MYYVIGNIIIILYLSIIIDFQSPIEINPLKVLVSVIHDTESIIHKAVDAKEAELAKKLKGDDNIIYKTSKHSL